MEFIPDHRGTAEFSLLAEKSSNIERQFRHELFNFLQTVKAVARLV
jgi:hypothetical protein